MLKKIYIPVIVALFMQLSLFAQNTSSGTQAARKEYLALKYALVTKMLEKELKDHPGDIEAQEMIADSYRKIKNYDKALYWYSELTKAPTPKSQWALCYAEVLANKQQYESSEEWYLKYLNMVNDDKRAVSFATLYPQVDPLFYDRKEWKVSYLNINTAASEFAPLYYKQGLIFSSSRKITGVVKRVFEWDQTPFTDLYYIDKLTDIKAINVDSLSAALRSGGKLKAERPYRGNNDYTGSSSNDTKVLGTYDLKLAKDTMGDYLAPQVHFSQLPGNVNTKYHEGAAALLPDGSLMFTRNNYNNGEYGKSKEGINKLKLYIAKAPDWQTVEPFRYNNDQYSVGDPAINKDGTLLIFASDMPGGKGGVDLYFCKRASVADEWSQPVNMGDLINTEGNEVFPVIYRDSTLVFSSTGHPGLGGLDIFQVPLKGEQPLRRPVNLGAPINSSLDDFGFIRSDDGATGYFSSNRRGSDDIYSFAYHPFRITLQGAVVDRATNLPLGQMHINTQPDIKLKIDEQSKFNGILKKGTTYHITATRDGYDPVSADVSTKGITSDTTLIVLLKPEKKLPVFSFNCDSVRKVLTMNNIYYNFNKAFIRADAESVMTSIITLLKNDASLNLVIASYCDSRGAESFNLELSKRRSESARSYLLSAGIAASRVQIEYFGESNLVNNCTDGVPCSKEAQQLNRRSEFFLTKDGKKVLSLNCDLLEQAFPQFRHQVK